MYVDIARVEQQASFVSGGRDSIDDKATNATQLPNASRNSVHTQKVVIRLRFPALPPPLAQQMKEK